LSITICFTLCTYLKDNENAAYDAGVSINHGLFHDVTNAAQMVCFNWVLLAQDACDGKVGVGGQKIELVYAHCTNMVQQLVYNLIRGYSLFWKMKRNSVRKDSVDGPQGADHQLTKAVGAGKLVWLISSTSAGEASVR
jgi:hypothetical protein